MIQRENRLKKNKHFKFIYKHGETKHTKTLSVVFVKTKIKPFKVGFSVSKKIGKSVVRNKVKRRLCASFAEISKNVDKSYNYVFIAKDGLSELTYQDIKQNMIELIKRANLYVD